MALEGILCYIVRRIIFANYYISHGGEYVMTAVLIVSKYNLISVEVCHEGITVICTPRLSILWSTVCGIRCPILCFSLSILSGPSL
jgi:hypothetical protein